MNLIALLWAKMVNGAFPQMRCTVLKFTPYAAE